MRMDPYGRMVDSLSELWESLDEPDLVKDAGPVRKALEKAMTVCVEVERLRRARTTPAPSPDAMTTSALRAA